MKRGRKELKILVGIALASLVCGFVLIAAIPARAYAADGFIGGLQDLVGVREVEALNYEEDYLRDYEGVTRADPPEPGTNTLTDLGEDATTVDYVNDTVDKFNSVKVGSGSFTWLQAVQVILGNPSSANSHGGILRQLYILPAIGLVFMWWGVRKSLKIVMSAFRKGSMNV